MILVNRTSCAYVKITKYKNGKPVSSEYVDGFEKSYEAFTSTTAKERSHASTWGAMVKKICLLCKLRYTARASVQNKCYRCRYHITRIAKTKEYKGMPINESHKLVIQYLKNNPKILEQPMSGWYVIRHNESLKGLNQ